MLETKLVATRLALPGYWIFFKVEDFFRNEGRPCGTVFCFSGAASNDRQQVTYYYLPIINPFATEIARFSRFSWTRKDPSKLGIHQFFVWLCYYTPPPQRWRQYFGGFFFTAIICQQGLRFSKVELYCQVPSISRVGWFPVFSFIITYMGWMYSSIFIIIIIILGGCDIFQGFLSFRKKKRENSASHWLWGSIPCFDDFERMRGVLFRY